MLVCRRRGSSAGGFRISAAYADYEAVLALRERMNRGGKRRHRMDGILRDYTPSPVDLERSRG